MKYLPLALFSCALLNACMANSPSNEHCPPGGCTEDNVKYEGGYSVQFPAPSNCDEVSDTKERSKCKSQAAILTDAIKQHQSQ